MAFADLHLIGELFAALSGREQLIAACLDRRSRRSQQQRDRYRARRDFEPGVHARKLAESRRRYREKKQDAAWLANRRAKAAAWMRSRRASKKRTDATRAKERAYLARRKKTDAAFLERLRAKKREEQRRRRARLRTSQQEAA